MHRFALLGLLVAGVGCKGAVNDHPGSVTGAGVAGGPGGGGGAGSPGGAGAAGGASGANGAAGASAQGVPPASSVGTLALHRLNRVEYNNTVRDLLGTTLAPADDFIEDELGSKPGAGFDNLADNLGANPSVARISQYLTAAKALVKDAMATPELKARVIFCDVAAAGCVDQVLATFAQRAWRRPVAAGELAPLKAMVTLATGAGDDLTTGIGLAMAVVLTSPHFVFRVEAGAAVDGRPRLLNNFELASRLSYFLWSTMPDEALFAAAAGNQLTTPNGLMAATDRALADPRAAQLVSNFAGQWLYTRNLPTHDVDPQFYGNYPQLADSMRRETELYFRDFLYGAQSLKELLTANFSYVDNVLAKHYGLVQSPGQFATRVTLDVPQRRGLLTQAGILTVTSHSGQTSPVKRGKWVLYNLLCTAIELPANFTPPPLKPRPVGGTLRTQLEEHGALEPCKSCHMSLDPIGFALENYDAVGRFRAADENHIAIDASGTWTDGARFSGAVEMEKVITNDPRFAPCLVKNLYSYAVGRTWADADQPAIDQIVDGATKNGFTMKEIIHQIVASEPFRMQYPPNLTAGGGP